jgi:hypothetical protein
MLRHVWLFVFCALCIDFGSSGAIARCDPDEIQIGQDHLYDYCLKKSVVISCQAKGGNVAKCINAGCIGTSGADQQGEIAECKNANQTCLEEHGATAALIGSIVGCMVGLAAESLPGCYGGTVVGAAVHDSAVYICKAKFGDCVAPSLQKAKHFKDFCDQYSPAQ